MKKLRLILLGTFALALSAKQSHAQVEVTYGPELVGSVTTLVEDGEAYYAGVAGQVGAASHIQFGRFVAVRPSVFFKTSTMWGSEYDDDKMWLQYVGVNLPVLFSYHFERGHKLFAGAGPSLLYAVGGKRQTGDYYGEISKKKIKFGTAGEDEMKPLEFGIHIRMGFQFAKGLSLGYYYNVGLSNITPNNGGYKTNTMDFAGITVGWMFGGNSED